MKNKTIALLAASALALAACSGAKHDEAPAAETNVTNLTTTPENFANVATTAPPATRVDNTSTTSTAPPAATLTADEMTQDAADASGMTSRVNRDEAGNDSGQPAH